MNKRDFVSLSDFSIQELDKLISRAIALKEERAKNINHDPLRGKTGILMLQQNSTRTRLAFEAGMTQLGGHSIFLSDQDSQASRGEPLEDFARVASQMADVIMIRHPDQQEIESLAKHALIPVINGMSSDLHPCQLLADVQTFKEIKGPIADRSVAFIGDGYNMCNSYIEASAIFEFNLHIATPIGYEPKPEFLAMSQNITLHESPQQAVAEADLVVTDVWSSMGHEEENASRLEHFRPYQVNKKLLDLAKKDAIFMHCLPAHKGEEISPELLNDSRSAVWQEAGNRLHTQKALLEFLLTPS